MIVRHIVHALSTCVQCRLSTSGCQLSVDHEHVACVYYQPRAGLRPPDLCADQDWRRRQGWRRRREAGERCSDSSHPRPYHPHSPHHCVLLVVLPQLNQRCYRQDNFPLSLLKRLSGHGIWRKLLADTCR